MKMVRGTNAAFYAPNVLSEEATKNTVVMPIFQFWGYAVFNPEEFVTEFTADVGIKKGKRSNYAIKIDGHPVLLVEVKPARAKLEEYDSQLSFSGYKSNNLVY